MQSDVDGVGSIQVVGTRGDGYVGASGGVDDGIGQHQTAALGRSDDCSLHASVFDPCPAADRAEPDLGVRFAKLATVPLHLVFDVVLFVGERHFCGETNITAVIGFADQTKRSEAAEPFEVFDDQRLGPASGGADGRGRTGCATSDHGHVAAT